MAWYKIAVELTLSRGITVEYLTRHLYFLGIYTGLKAYVYTRKCKRVEGYVHGIPLEIVA